MAKLGEFARALKLVSLIFALALGFASATAKADEDYPEPAGAHHRVVLGRRADRHRRARLRRKSCRELLGQQFFVENKVGAGGNIGADQVAKSPPDGYTLLVATVSTHAINPGLYAKMPYDPVQGFRAGRAGRRHADHARRASLDPGEGREEPDRAGEGESRQVHLRLVRARLDPSSVRRAVQVARGRPATSSTCPIAARRR